MGHTSSKHGPSVAEIFDATLTETAALFVVNPAEEMVAALIGVAGSYEGELPEIRLLGTERTIKKAFDDFLVASNAAELTEQGTLSLRTGKLSHNTVLLTEETVYALVTTDQHAAALASDEAAFINAVETAYQHKWDRGDPYKLRTPSISRIRETLEAEINEEIRTDFDRMLDTLETAEDVRGDLDEVTISLLVAAKNEVLLYDISRWGEDIGIASKATFSRTKTRLEDKGLIDTEKVPIDVGRPRLRLQPGDKRLEEADIPELVSIAHETLAS